MTEWKTTGYLHWFELLGESSNSEGQELSHVLRRKNSYGPDGLAAAQTEGKSVTKDNSERFGFSKQVNSSSVHSDREDPEGAHLE